MARRKSNGNGHGGKILQRARLSPIAMTQKPGEEEVARPYHAIRDALTEWTDRLRKQAGCKVLADRALSRLLKKSWPRSIDDLDQDTPRPGQE